MKVTVADAARLLAIPEQVVYDWIRDRGLPHVKVQDRYFIHRARLHEWARERGVRVHPDLFLEAGVAGNALGAELADTLRHGGLHRLPGPRSTWAGAEAILAAIALPSSIDCRVLCEIVAARRDLGFAVDRDGIALPRLDEPILAPGPPSLFLFAFEPAWALGEVRVDRGFVLVAPTVRLHQRLLAELGAALHEPEFRAAVRRADTSECLEEVARHTSISAPAVAAK